jgi:alpha-beta hydrolase superfamily lysophospholipase
METKKKSKTIVLIHGLWLSALSWEHWVERYRARGFNVIAKSWPGMERDVASLRTDHAAIDTLGIAEVVDHYESIVRELPEPPILMGHSMGGVVVQILLDRGHGSAGVAIDPGPTKGVLSLPLSALRSAFPALKNPANNHRSVMLTPEQFHYAFTNTLSVEESARMYDRYAVPGPGRVLFQAALANFNPSATTRVDFYNSDRAPLLLVAGGADHTAPAAVTRAEAKLQGKSFALTAYKEFPGRSHFTIGQPGWEEVADFALDWAENPVELHGQP